MNELIKDAELEKVVGGSGTQCIGILSQLKNKGVDIKTSLVAGNESDAVSELYKLAGFKAGFKPKNDGGGGDWQASVTNNNIDFSGSVFYADGTANVYKLDGKVISEDEFVTQLAKKLGK